MIKAKIYTRIVTRCDECPNWERCRTNGNTRNRRGRIDTVSDTCPLTDKPVTPGICPKCDLPLIREQHISRIDMQPFNLDVCNKCGSEYPVD